MKKSLITFNGSDYSLIHALPYLSTYIMQCNDAGISVDILFKKAKILVDFVLNNLVVNNVFKDESNIKLDSYTFNRVITCEYNSVCDSFQRRLCMSLGLKYRGCLNWLDIDSDAYCIKNIMKASKITPRAFNAVYFNAEDSSEFDGDVSRTIVTLQSDSRPTLVIGKPLYLIPGVTLNDIFSLISILSVSNMFVGSDGIISQIAIHLGIPSIVFVKNKMLIKIITSLPNVTYKDSANVGKTAIDFSCRYWDLSSCHS